MRSAILIIFLFFVSILSAFAQGLNHNFLIGDDANPWPPYTIYPKGIIKIDTANFSIFGLSRKMIFFDAQANISNEMGDILFYTNGCWIANALEDTMQNGAGLNPDPVVTQVCTPPSALPLPQANIILPFPGDSTKYVLFHHGASQADPFSYPLVFYYSVIDMSLNNGLGAVIQKNQILIQDGLNRGISACKHANGRDWWVVILKHTSDTIYKVLLTDQGISNVSTQSLGTFHGRNEGQRSFSPDGKKFAYRYISGTVGNVLEEVRLFDFDRCSGTFSNPKIASWTSAYGSLGLAFSSNSKYLYTVSNFDTLYQINTDTSNIQASMQVVAINDYFISPVLPHRTSFFTMYLAANGKITISSGGGVVDLGYINYPDSAGLACDVQQHALPMPCFVVGPHVNHPNYYLGCDTTCGPCFVVGINEPGKHDFKFSLSPNPSSGAVKIIYQLPQNKSGVFDLYDITGKKVFTYTLPPWSTLQHFDLSFLSNGMYHAVITSDGFTKAEKLVLLRP